MDTITRDIGNRRPRLVTTHRRRPASPYMTPADFEYLGRAICQSKKWKASFSALLDMPVSTVSWWCDGSLPIPKHMAVCVWALYTARQRGAFPVPEPDPRWDQYAWMEGAELPPVEPRQQD